MLPELPVSRHRALAIAAIVALALFIFGKFVLGAGTASGEYAAPPPVATEEVTAARAVVHVVGAVRRPGLYRLPEGSRTADAIDRAGGATRKADLALVNLAAPVADGQQIVVPRRAAAAGLSPGGGGSAAATGPVHLNTATLEELDALPGVGPVTAQKILDYREQHGAFSSVDELDAIAGIGPARLESLREVVAP